MKRTHTHRQRRTPSSSPLKPQTPRSPALVRAQLALGLPLIGGTAAGVHQPVVVSAHALRALRRVPLGGACFVCGPSGSGKSTHLREFARQIAGLGGALLVLNGPGSPPRPRAMARRLIELGAGLSLRRWLTILSHTGLAEAGLFARSLCELSEGQLHRAKVAMLLGRAERLARRRLRGVKKHPPGDPGVWIVADELTTGLDRQTAVSLAAGLSRFVASTATGTSPLRLLVSAHDPALGEALRARVRIVCRLNAPATVLLRR